MGRSTSAAGSPRIRRTRRASPSTPPGSGRALAAEGALGRFSVDFVAAADASGSWDVYAIEVNLRKGGTTHPYAALRNLVPGRYDVATGGPGRRGRRGPGLHLDRQPGRRIVARAGACRRHRLGGSSGPPVRPRDQGWDRAPHARRRWAIDGRCGATAIALMPDEADAMYEEVRATIQRLADRRATYWRAFARLAGGRGGGLSPRGGSGTPRSGCRRGSCRLP